MINGYGEVTISSCPARNTVLQLHEASCDRIFTCTSDYLEIMDIREGETESIIRLANTAKNFNSVGDVKIIKIQGNEYEISEVTNTDSSIYLKTNSSVQYEKSLGNYLKILQ